MASEPNPPSPTEPSDPDFEPQERATSPETWSSQEDSTNVEENPTRISSANANTSTDRKPRRLKLWKTYQDSSEPRWWFASTAIPLLAATLGPLANVLSIAALVTYWRSKLLVNDSLVSDFQGVPFPDPRWCYWLNVASLIFGFLGNLFLLLNFTQRIPYKVALPSTILFWFLATGFLIGITSCMHMYAPPNRPFETYTQGFWYAVAAAAVYFMCSAMLMVNMLGFARGLYPDHFALTDAQRTLILQTMMFFIWLAGGAALFARLETDAGEEGWGFADALYFCDVTILTVGFGDMVPSTDVGRGIIFPYSVGGIITLGLVISSIYKFLRQLGDENIIQRHIQRMRAETYSRTVTNSFDLRQREHDAHHLIRRRSAIRKDAISAPVSGRPYRTPMGEPVKRTSQHRTGGNKITALARGLPLATKVPSLGLQRSPKRRLLLLRAEKDRFEAMRRIQAKTSQFKRWWALTFSIAAFAILWCVGAIVFWQAEKHVQGLSYFQALYFCYVSLLTVGYGDLAPKSNAGRCFFVVWSLIAVPTMTILVSDLGDTVVAKFKTASDRLADFTVLPQYGIWRQFLEAHPWLLNWVQVRVEKRAARKRIEKGFETMDPDREVGEGNREAGDKDEEQGDDENETEQRRTVEEDDEGNPLTTHALAKRLAYAIQSVAKDLHLPEAKRYSFEEWVEFTRLIRRSSKDPDACGEAVVTVDEQDDEGLVEWDWIGENSPLVSSMTESEWLLERLCESLVRVERRKEAKGKQQAPG